MLCGPEIARSTSGCSISVPSVPLFCWRSPSKSSGFVPQFPHHSMVVTAIYPGLYSQREGWRSQFKCSLLADSNIHHFRPHLHSQTGVCQSTFWPLSEAVEIAEQPSGFLSSPEWPRGLNKNAFLSNFFLRPDDCACACIAPTTGLWVRFPFPDR